MNQTLPELQSALELTGPDQLRINPAKCIYPAGPYQIVARVEAVGLCFSDLKLLKQFDRHPRKGDIVEGIDFGVLAEVPSYRPASQTTVPGHEACCRIVAVGEKVRHHHVGQRVLVQTDYRWLKTKNSNGSFGYNFEGALQQYVLMDERVIVEPETQESFLIPVDDALSASAIALAEPWACVESSYITPERKNLRGGGRLLIMAEKGCNVSRLGECFAGGEHSAVIDIICHEEAQYAAMSKLFPSPPARYQNLTALPRGDYDDIIYFGAEKETIEILDDRLAQGGMLNIVLAGQKISENVSISLGRIHYAGVRYIGTTGDNPADSYRRIPDNGEITDEDAVLIMGAGGPMGQMHVIRTIFSGRRNLAITAADLDDNRLSLLAEKTRELAQRRGVKLVFQNPRHQTAFEPHRYYTIMAPSAPLVAAAIDTAQRSARLNLFAGIPVGVKHPVNLQRYLEQECYMFGSSGSRLSDMKIVWDKIRREMLDSDISVDAVGGLAGAIEGLQAVEHGAIPGKIIIYPGARNAPLTTLAQLKTSYPTVAAKLHKGRWNKQAEEEFLAVTGKGAS